MQRYYSRHHRAEVLKEKPDYNPIFDAIVVGNGLFRDRVTGSAFAQTYAGTNRTVTAADGSNQAVPANTIPIDYVSGVPALRLEPAAANILLEVLTDWTDTTLTPIKNTVSWAGAVNGAYTVTASGANGTLISSAVTATSAAFTFVCAIKRSVGTGAVYMTVDNGATWTEKTLTTSYQYFNVTKTAANPQLGFKLATSGDAIIVDCLMLVPNTAIASSYFAPAAAIGDELVTDGGFAAVTAGGDIFSTHDATFDIDCANLAAFNAADYTWEGAGAAPVVSVASNVLSVESDATNEGIRFPALIPTTGICRYLSFNVTAITGTWAVKIHDGSSYITIITFTTTGVKSCYLSPVLTNGTLYIISDSGTLEITATTPNSWQAITFTNWTAGAGWAPQATAGALTGKAQKVAGTASDLTQTTAAAEAGKVYRVGNTAVRTAGTLTPEFGSTNGVVISANGTYYDYPIAADTDYIKFKADSSFAGSVDTVSVKEHGTVRLSEAGTVTLAIPAAVSNALAATGTLVVDWMPSYDRAAGVVTGIVSTDGNTASLLYTTTAAGNLSSFDGTAVAESTAAYTKNVWHRLVTKWPSDTDKYKVGASIAMAGVAYGSEAAFDGAITAGANLVIAPAVHGTMWIKSIKIYNKVLTDAQINAMR